MNAPLRHHPVIETFVGFAHRFNSIERRLNGARAGLRGNDVDPILDEKKLLLEEIASSFILTRRVGA